MNLDWRGDKSDGQASSTGRSCSKARGQTQLRGRRSCHDWLYQQRLSPGLDLGEASSGSSSPGLASVSGAAEDRASPCCTCLLYAVTAQATWPHHPRKQQAHQRGVCSGSLLVTSTGCHLLRIYCLSGIGTCSHLILNRVLSGKFYYSPISWMRELMFRGPCNFPRLTKLLFDSELF